MRMIKGEVGKCIFKIFLYLFPFSEPRYCISVWISFCKVISNLSHFIKIFSLHVQNVSYVDQIQFFFL